MVIRSIKNQNCLPTTAHLRLPANSRRQTVPKRSAATHEVRRRSLEAVSNILFSHPEVTGLGGYLLILRTIAPDPHRSLITSCLKKARLDHVFLNARDFGDLRAPFSNAMDFVMESTKGITDKPLLRPFAPVSESVKIVYSKGEEYLRQFLLSGTERPEIEEDQQENLKKAADFIRTCIIAQTTPYTGPMPAAFNRHRGAFSTSLCQHLIKLQATRWYIASRVYPDFSKGAGPCFYEEFVPGWKRPIPQVVLSRNLHEYLFRYNLIVALEILLAEHIGILINDKSQSNNGNTFWDDALTLFETQWLKAPSLS